MKKIIVLFCFLFAGYYIASYFIFSAIEKKCLDELSDLSLVLNTPKYCSCATNHLKSEGLLTTVLKRDDSSYQKKQEEILDVICFEPSLTSVGKFGSKIKKFTDLFD